MTPRYEYEIVESPTLEELAELSGEGWEVASADWFDSFEDDGYGIPTACRAIARVLLKRPLTTETA